jgi:hypothetical protein
MDEVASIEVLSDVEEPEATTRGTTKPLLESSERPLLCLDNLDDVLLFDLDLIAEIEY